MHSVGNLGTRYDARCICHVILPTAILCSNWIQPTFLTTTPRIGSASASLRFNNVATGWPMVPAQWGDIYETQIYCPYTAMVSDPPLSTLIYSALSPMKIWIVIITPSKSVTRFAFSVFTTGSYDFSINYIFSFFIYVYFYFYVGTFISQ